MRHLVLGLWILILAAAQTNPTYDDLQRLAQDFGTWRTVHQPLTGDDVTRIERPFGWLPDWSPATVAARKQALQDFQQRWAVLDTTGWTIPQQVDYRLVGSGLARVDWELNVNPAWQRSPLFYIDQTLGSIFEILLPPPPFDEARSTAVVRRMEQIPRTVEEAQANLDQTVRPFAELAVAELQLARSRLETVAHELTPLLSGPDAARLPAATEAAISSLEAFQGWLIARLPEMSTETAVGREAYLFFLQRVALLPFTPEELVAMARQEWERSMTFEAYEQQRNEGVPALPLFPDQAEQIEQNARQEEAVRRFLEEKGILSVPDWMQHYLNQPLPAYLAPLAHLGVIDDLTSPTRLDENGVSYIPPPSPDLGYFSLATAKDPRPILVHEGVPGHYFQLALSWAHDNPIRRRYYDSGANEGIGFYAEEMMLQAGYFDDSPKTREIIYNFMRLRALRVEVDVKLATGAFTIAEAGDYLRRTVPMDAETAEWEAAFFASTPGQAISYQIGKLQIVQLLSEARMMQGDAFRLQDVHDFVWLNGNVPIALQRWEYLGLSDQIEKLDGR